MKTRTKRIAFIAVCLIMAFYTMPAVAKVDKVNINTAPKAQLVTLKYVGDALAQRIIEYREKNPFQIIEDLMNVKGIGPKVFEANKDIICVKDE